MSLRAPALFVGHGSPMNAIEDTPSARGWAEIARAFPKPNAIVVISAHWVTEGVRVMLDDTWGLDHGAWSVLVHMYPDADIPIVQVSLDARRGPEEHYAIARALAPLRDENVLILAAGNIVHNLPAFFRTKQLEPWVQSFDAFVADAAESGDDAAVLRYPARPEARDAAPDWEHFFPVFYALGARREGEQAHVFNKYYDPGISMTAFAYGLPA